MTKANYLKGIVKKSDSGAMHRIDIPSGQAIDQAGMFFMNVATGEVESWAISGNGWARYDSSRDGRWVIASGPDGRYLADRTSGNIFQWDDRVQLLSAQGDYLFFAADNFMWLHRAGSDTKVDVLLPPDNPQARASPDGTALILVNGRKVYLVRPETGDSRAIGELPGVGAKGDRIQLMTARRGQEALVILYSGTDTGGRQQTRFQRYAWDGNQLADVAGSDGGDVSPDGRLVASAEWLPGIGPVVWIMDSLNLQPLYRVRGATLCTDRRVGDTFWLADGSALVVRTRNGFRLLKVDGTLAELQVYKETSAFHEAVPAPDNPHLFAIGRTKVVDDRGTQVSAAHVQAPANQSFVLDSSWVWGYGSDEIRFTLMSGGYDAFCPDIEIDPLVEQPPFAEGPPASKNR